MKIEFYVKDGDEFPFQAIYKRGENKGIPIIPRMGYGAPPCRNSQSYEHLLMDIIDDLKHCDENIEPIFGNGISEEVKAATSFLLKVLVKYNSSKRKLERLKDIIFEPDP